MDQDWQVSWGTCPLNSEITRLSLNSSLFWHVGVLWYVKCCKLRRGSITFSGPPPANICPTTVCGKVYTSELSLSDIRLISSVVNDNQTFLVEYTPFDNLTIAKRVLEQCFENKRKKSSHLLVGVRTLAIKIEASTARKFTKEISMSYFTAHRVIWVVHQHFQVPSTFGKNSL